MNTVNAHTDRAAHVKALKATGMSERQARVAEMRALVAEGARRRAAAGMPSNAERLAAFLARVEGR